MEQRISNFSLTNLTILFPKRFKYDDLLHKKIKDEYGHGHGAILTFFESFYSCNPNSFHTNE